MRVLRDLSLGTGTQSRRVGPGRFPPMNFIVCAIVCRCARQVLVLAPNKFIADAHVKVFEAIAKGTNIKIEA